MDSTTEAEKMDVGSLLRQRRESLGISLAAIAEKTRIRRIYLAALEENRFEDLPAAAYLSGFLRSYAGALGLDPDGILRQLRAQSAVSQDAGNEPRSPAGTVAVTSRRRRPLLFVLLAVLAVAGALLYVFSGPGADASAGSDDKRPLAAAVDTPAAEAVADGALPPSGGAAAAAAQSPADSTVVATSELPSISAAGGMVRLEARAPVALEVVVDDRLSQHYDLTAESVLHWKVARRFRLSADPPQAIALWLDEAPIPLPGGGGTLLLDGEGDAGEPAR